MIKLLKKCGFVVIGLVSAALLGGCTGQMESLNKEKDLDFTVISERDIPTTLKDVIVEKRESPFQISYTNGGELYIAVGYGKQDTGGYSITVNELYETPDAIVIDTTLLGPENKETMSPSYPYIVVKTESIPDKTIEFK